jgi:hypothetical protein
MGAMRINFIFFFIFIVLTSNVIDAAQLGSLDLNSSNPAVVLNSPRLAYTNRNNVWTGIQYFDTIIANVMNITTTNIIDVNVTVLNVSSICDANGCYTPTELNSRTNDSYVPYINANNNVNLGIHSLTAGNLFGNLNWSWLANVPNYLLKNEFNVTNNSYRTIWNNTFSENVTAEQDLIITGKLYGGSPVKVEGGMVMLSGHFAGSGSGLIDINQSNSSNYSLTSGDTYLFGGQPPSYYASNSTTYSKDEVNYIINSTKPVAFYQTTFLQVTGNGINYTSDQVNFLVTEIIVTPDNLSNGYYFEATQNSSGAMIDKSRIIHYGIWDIYKNHVILNDGIKFNITSSYDNFNITIKYINNYYGV